MLGGDAGHAQSMTSEFKRQIFLMTMLMTRSLQKRTESLMPNLTRQLINSWLATMILCTSGCTTRQEPVTPGSPPQSEDFSWGMPRNGLQIGLSFDRYEAEPQRSLLVRCAVRNVSNQPMRLISLNNRERRWLGSPPIGVELNGLSIARHFPAVETPIGTEMLDVLMPGQMWQVETPLVLANWDIPPGSSPRLKLALQGSSPETAEKADKEPPAPIRQWFGEVFSGPVDVTVPQ
jgi:hypothetical protein